MNNINAQQGQTNQMTSTIFFYVAATLLTTDIATEPYSKLRLQMRCENMIASSRKDFSILSMVTDSWIPACGVWAGDYPYLNRTAFRDFVATVDTSSAKGQRGVRSPGSGDSGTGSGSGRRPRKATSNNDDDMDRKQDIGNLESFVVNDVDAKYFDGFSGGDGVGYDYDGKSKDAYYSDSDVVQVSLDWQVELEEENVYSSIDFVENDNRIGLRRGKGEDFENDAQQSNDDDIDGRLKSVRRSARLQPLPRERQREARGPK